MKQIKDYFLTFDRNLNAAEGTSYTRSKYPVVECDDISISTNAAIIEDAKEEVKTISFVSSIPSTNFIKKTKNDKRAWYNNPKLLDSLRVRVVVCLNSQNSDTLDYVTQRFNEYLQGKMPTTGIKGAQEFVRKLLKYKKDETFDLSLSRMLAPKGPFDTEYISTFTDNINPRPVFYDRNSVLGNIVLYDSPLSEMILKNDDGSAKIRYEDSTPVFDDRGQTDVRRVMLKPIEINIGFEEQYENVNLQQLNFYAVVYNDMQKIIPAGMGMKSKITRDRRDRKTVLDVGSSFITSCIPIGFRTSYVSQQRETPVSPPINEDTVAFPDEAKLQDLTGVEIITIDNVRELIYKTFEQELNLSTGMDPETAKIISNDNHFSELWITKCENDYARYCFSFDRSSFLSSNSQFPWLYKNVNVGNDNFSLQNVLLENEKTEILSVKMKKRLIEQTPQISSNRLGTTAKVKTKGPSYTYPEMVVAPPQPIDNIFLQDTDIESDDIIFFEGYDTLEKDHKVQNVSLYQYGVEIEVSDPSELFIRRCAKSLRESENKVLRVHDFIVNSPRIGSGAPPQNLPVLDGAGLYDSVTSTRTVPMGDIMYGVILASEYVETEIGSYINFLRSFTSLSNEEAERVSNMLTSMMNAKEVVGLKRIAEYISVLATSLEKVLELSFPKDLYGQGTTRRSDVSNRNHNKANILRAEIYFDNLFDFGRVYQTGYNYMSTEERGDIENPMGMPTYSKTFLDERAQLEFNKYFGNYVTEENADSTADNNVPGYVNSSYQFFTPRTIKIYGEERLNQPSYRNPNQNLAKYDFNRYAEIFYDIINSNRETTYLNHPYYELKVQGIASPAQLGNAVLDELQMHSCFVKESTSAQNAAPSIKSVPPKSKSALGTENKTGSKNVGLFESVIGSNDQNDTTFKNVLDNVNAPYSLNATGSFGAIRELKDKNQITVKSLNEINASKPATKLLFNILGELELRPSANVVQSSDKDSFNSSLTDIERIGITAQNVKSMIEGPLSFYPNQLKSLYVTAVAQSQTVLGTGFDAIRIELEDQDAGPENKIISAVAPGESFPDYVSVRDPMKTYSKMLAFWMNYKQIAVLEYLAGFENLDTENLATDFDEVNVDTESFSSKVATPIWRKFDFSFYTENYDKTFLCRWRNISTEDVSQEKSEFVPKVERKDLFDLPIYNNYFVLRG